MTLHNPHPVCYARYFLIPPPPNFPPFPPISPISSNFPHFPHFPPFFETPKSRFGELVSSVAVSADACSTSAVHNSRVSAQNSNKNRPGVILMIAGSAEAEFGGGGGSIQNLQLRGSIKRTAKKIAKCAAACLAIESICPACPNYPGGRCSIKAGRQPCPALPNNSRPGAHKDANAEVESRLSLPSQSCHSFK